MHRRLLFLFSPRKGDRIRLRAGYERENLREILLKLINNSLKEAKEYTTIKVVWKCNLDEHEILL